MINIDPCPHKAAHANCEFNQLIKDGEPVGKQAVFTIKCADCGMPFHFPRLMPGSGEIIANTNHNGTELRIPVVPGPQQIPILLDEEPPVIPSMEETDAHN